MTTLPPEENNGADTPATPPTPPAAPQYEAPQAPPQAPPHYEAPQYQAPQPPAGGYAAPGADPAVSSLQLNYWLSVFFAWIPALIFWVIEKDKGNQRATAFHVANFNFSLLRTGVGIGISIFSFIPYIGWLIALVLWIGSIVLFVFHIMAAAKVTNEYRSNGSTDPFVFNIPLIK